MLLELRFYLAAAVYDRCHMAKQLIKMREKNQLA